MKLSEAIILGNTLIAESHICFYNSAFPPCGCAIGSAAAAVGDLTDDARKWISWTHARWPWTQAIPQAAWLLYERYLKAWEEGGRDPICANPLTVADLISVTHCLGVPRLEIAELLQDCEPEDKEYDDEESRLVHNPGAASRP